MKKSMIFILTFLVVALALNVQAATINFSPRVVQYEVAPGEIGMATLGAYGLSSGAYTLYFSIGSRFLNGNIPVGWLDPVTAQLVARPDGRSSTVMDLVVNVPADAKAGSYTGLLVPEDIRSTEPISSQGVYVDIEVVVNSPICSTPPSFTNVEIGPQEIWAPSDRDVEISITGIISMVEGCEVTAGYSLESNTGPVQGDINIASDGSFSETILANVSRSGKDKDGRTYNGILFVVGADGESVTVGFAVTVLHDKGQKKGLEK